MASSGAAEVLGRAAARPPALKEEATVSGENVADDDANDDSYSSSSLAADHRSSPFNAAVHNGRCAAGRSFLPGSATPPTPTTTQDAAGPNRTRLQEQTTKAHKIKELVQHTASDASKLVVSKILAEVKQLPDIEKLLLYVQLPTGNSDSIDSQKQNGNPLGSRYEIKQTIIWIKTHLEENSDVSLPKQEVYDDYTHYCSTHDFKPLSTADFGKVMKYVFPSVRPRRLGTRGNSKYCYSGLRKKILLEVPKLPDVTVGLDDHQDDALSLRGLSDDLVSACSYVILEWAYKLLDLKFNSLKELACHLVKSNIVDVRSVGAFTVLSLLPDNGNQATALLSQSGGNKHRETQLQLQRKLQEKELIREQKKKLQELKSDKAPAHKERRRVASGPCGPSTRFSRSTQPLHGYSQPTTPVHRESPIFPSNQGIPNLSASGSTESLESDKLEISEIGNGRSQSSKIMDTSTPNKHLMSKSNSELSADKKPGKIQIPRITSHRQNSKAQLPPAAVFIMQSVPQLPDVGKKLEKQKTKYKPIQPKPSSTINTPTSALQSVSETNESVTSTNDSKSAEESCGEMTNSPTAVKNHVGVNADSLTPVETSNTIKRTWDGGKELENVAVCKRSRPTANMVVTETNSSELGQEQCSAFPSLSELDSLKISDCLDSSTPEAEPDISTMNPLQPLMSVNTIENEGLMDYFEGSSTSMEQDEELSQYFKETDEKHGTNVNGTSAPTTVKKVNENGQAAQISQLRQLLEHNLTSGSRFHKRTVSQASEADSASKSKVDIRTQPTTTENRGVSFKTNAESAASLCQYLKSMMNLKQPSDNVGCNQELQAIPTMELFSHCLNQQTQQVAENPVVHEVSNGAAALSMAARRRVSFPSNLIMSEPLANLSHVQLPISQSSVPPSPNTRCRSFNFMPISSPHQISVSEMAQNMGKSAATSQPPSASASPFVSPRSTPNPHCRSRHNSGQALSSSYATTPRSTPYPPSEQSSNINSPFISPHATPIPFPRSRHNSSQNLQRAVPFAPNQISSNNHALVLNCQSRSRHSSGATMSLMSPRSAPMSPMNYIVDPDGGSSVQFSMPTLGDTPQMRSRHNSNSSIPPVSPRSAPLSPLTPQHTFNLPVADGPRNVAEVSPLANVNSSLPSAITAAEQEMVEPKDSGWSSTDKKFLPQEDYNPQLTAWISDHSAGLINDSRTAVRQRHASVGNPMHNLSNQSTVMPIYPNTIRDVNSLLQYPNNMMQQRSQSVPLNQMIQDLLQNQHANSDNQFDPSLSSASLEQPSLQQSNGTMLYSVATGSAVSSSLDSLGGPPSSDEYLSQKNLNDFLVAPSSPVNDDLQATLEDLRDCDNDYSKFAEEIEQQQYNSNT